MTIEHVLGTMCEENTKISEEQLDKFFYRDKWISANEALSYGLIDEII